MQRAEGTNDELATGLAVGAGEAEMALPAGSEEAVWLQSEVFAPRRGGSRESLSHSPEMAGSGRRDAESSRKPPTLRFLLLPPASPVFAMESGKQKTAPKDRLTRLIFFWKFGAGEGIRTPDPNLGKVAYSLFWGIPGNPISLPTH